MTRITQVLFAFLLTLVLSNCKILKTLKVLKSGSVAQKNFKEVISFESRAGLIIVKVNINGKDYNFIYDSGAVNCVTKEVAEELHLKTILDQTAVDSEGKRGGLQFALLDELKLGRLSFLKTSAAIIDLKAVPELACLHVDGLIGANLMRKAFWQIDYQKKTLTAASSMDSLSVPANAPCFDFSPEISGTPIVEMKVNGIVSKGNIFDTGSSGDIVLPSSTFKKLLEVNKNLKYARGCGSNSAGLYGRGNDTMRVALIDSSRMGNFLLKNHAIEFKRAKGGNLGSAFFKDYIVTMNWQKKKIWFRPQAKDESSVWENFGFTANTQDKKLIVAFLFENSPASEGGLKLGDQILSIDGKDFSEIKAEDYCNMIINAAPWKKGKKITLEIKPADGGAQRIVTLEKRNLLE